MKTNTKIAAAVFAAIPLVILSAATLTTWAIAHGASTDWRLLFRVMCHGIPSRCLTLWNVPMPICARCTAIYAGFFAGLMTFLAIRTDRLRTLRWFAIVAVLPLALDGLTQAAGLRESTNTLRMATGLLAAFAFGMWVLCAVETA